MAFFRFFSAILTNVTQPVAMASLAASGLAGSRYFGTAFEATKAAVGLFFLPFLVVWCPVLLLNPSDPISGIVLLIAVSCPFLAISTALVKHYLTGLNPLTRALTAVSAAGLLGYVFAENYMPPLPGLLSLFF